MMAKLNHCDSASPVRVACLGLLSLSVVVTTAGLVQGSNTSKEQTDSRQQPSLLRLLRESRAPYDIFATRFIQRKHMTLLDMDLESQGMIFFRRPDAVRYEIISPVRSIMMYDGKKVRCYAFSEGKWNLLNSPGANAIGQVLRQIGRWIQGDFDADRKMFDISVVSSEDGDGCIHMAPRSKALAEYIRGIEIYVAKTPKGYQVTRVLIRESDVDTTEMRFRREVRNQPIPEGTFSSPDASAACLAMFPQKEASDPNEAGEPKP
ncbi:MAG: outer membrane lipoprotein carrier protein LolA [Sedimentisphaerales bacterium]|nr:outer membrane lipoprotein carrier protein LolA [Sedimentisphaerales bacterium]